MRIAEIYSSRQGEGLLTGTPSVFVRASGCNLRCWFCDTPYTSWQPEGDDVSVDEIVRQVIEIRKSISGERVASDAAIGTPECQPPTSDPRPPTPGRIAAMPC